MRPGTRRNLVHGLEGQARELIEAAEALKEAELPDLRRVAVRWGALGCQITIGGTYVFQAGKDEPHLVAILRSLAWGLFEARRDSGNPEDPKARDAIRELLVDVVEHLPGGPKWAHTTPCPKCGNLRHICVACDGECKVDPMVEVAHSWQMKLCPECSGWLAPEEPR